jgi:hypothetical protein
MACGWRLVEQETAEGEPISARAIGQPAKVADAGKSLGQHMLDETSQKLFSR